MSATYECPLCKKIYERKDDIVFRKGSAVQCMKCDKSNYHYYRATQKFQAKDGSVKEYKTQQKYRKHERTQSITRKITKADFKLLFNTDAVREMVIVRYHVVEDEEEPPEQSE